MIKLYYTIIYWAKGNSWSVAGTLASIRMMLDADDKRQMDFHKFIVKKEE